MTTTAMLTRPLEVHVYEFVGEVWVAEPRDEIQAVLLAVHEAGGSLDAAGLADALFSQRFEAAARRLLQLAASIDLVHIEQDRRRGDRYSLTDRGRIALDREVILVPEKGTWLAWLANDPLVHTPVLHLEAVAPATAFDERQGNNSARRLRDRNDSVSPGAPDAMPRALRDAVDAPLFLPTTGRELEIRELGPTVRRYSAGGQSELALHLPLQGEPVVRLTGTLDADHPRRKSRETLRLDWQVPAREIDQHQVVEHIIESANTEWTWDRQDCCARVHSMDSLEPSDRASMRRRQIKTRVNLTTHGLGFFSDAELSEVRLAPASQGVANSWAGWKLLMACATQHQTVSRFAESCSAARTPFHPEWKPRLPTREQLAGGVASHNRSDAAPSRLFWMLQAAEDWEL